MNTPVKESEERLLSAILYNAEEAMSKIGHLTDVMFSVSKYGMIYNLMSEMVDAGEVVDYVSLANRIDWLKPSELVGMVDRFIPSTQYVRIDVEIITDAYRKRRMREKMQKILDESQHSDDMLSLLQDELDSLNDIGSIGEESLVAQTDRWAQDLEESLNTGGTTGLQSYYGAYNAMTGGYKNNHLVVIGARPKVGKTTYGLNEAYHMAKGGISTAIISLEMGSDELITKLAGIDSNVRGLNYLDEKKLLQAVEAKAKIDKLPLHIVDNTSSDYRAILNKCRQLIRKEDVKIIFIDYLQLMTGNQSVNRNNEISEITRAIKQFNRKYKVPIVLLSQLSRLSERDGNREPRFSDLRDSGSIEQDANVIVFLHKDVESDDMVKIIVAGCRGGSTGFFACRFDKPASRIDAIDNRRAE